MDLVAKEENASAYPLDTSYAIVWSYSIPFTVPCYLNEKVCEQTTCCMIAIALFCEDVYEDTWKTQERIINCMSLKNIMIIKNIYGRSTITMWFQKVNVYQESVTNEPTEKLTSTF